MFSGLSAFPLTPLTPLTSSRAAAIDEKAFVGLIERLVDAGVDSIAVLGSTGNYAYLTRSERAQVTRLALEHAGKLPVIVGIGALSTREVLELAEDAQQAGAQGLLLAPMSYQPLTDDEVFGLYAAVSDELSVPLCVYDNPATTHFAFSDVLHARIAQLPNIGSIKIPPVAADPRIAARRVQGLRALLPPQVTLGISGDAAGANGLLAGCEAWYSALAGLFPHICLAIARAAQAGDAEQARQRSDRLAPLWALFARHGSLRVIATAAELCGLLAAPALPLPLHPLGGDSRQQLTSALKGLELL